jgi:hypothetical protein
MSSSRSREYRRQSEAREPALLSLFSGASGAEAQLCTMQGTYVAEARRTVASEVKFPPGHYVSWSGQFEYLERAEARLKIVIPVTLLIIFLLLYLDFGRLAETLIVMLSLPFAFIGDFWLMWWLGFNLTVAIAVGFIALAGVAAQTGVVMLTYLDHAWNERLARTAAEGRAGQPPGPLRGHHGGGGRTGEAQDDDRHRHHRGSAAYLVEHRNRVRSHTAHCRADGRRHDLVNASDAARNPGNLRPGERLASTDGSKPQAAVRATGPG